MNKLIIKGKQTITDRKFDSTIDMEFKNYRDAFNAFDCLSRHIADKVELELILESNKNDVKQDLDLPF